MLTGVIYQIFYQRGQKNEYVYRIIHDFSDLAQGCKNYDEFIESGQSRGDSKECCRPVLLSERLVLFSSTELC